MWCAKGRYMVCGEGVRPKCCNSGGNHSVAYWVCDVQRREAVKMAGQENQVKEHGRDKRQVVMNVGQDDKRKLWIEKKKL